MMRINGWENLRIKTEACGKGVLNAKVYCWSDRRQEVEEVGIRLLMKFWWEPAKLICLLMTRSVTKPIRRSHPPHQTPRSPFRRPSHTRDGEKRRHDCCQQVLRDWNCPRARPGLHVRCRLLLLRRQKCRIPRRVWGGWKWDLQEVLWSLTHFCSSSAAIRSNMLS